jgi:hypothetical protein
MTVLALQKDQYVFYIDVDGVGFIRLKQIGWFILSVLSLLFLSFPSHAFSIFALD